MKSNHFLKGYQPKTIFSGNSNILGRFLISGFDLKVSRRSEYFSATFLMWIFTVIFEIRIFITPKTSVRIIWIFDSFYETAET